MRPVDRGRDDDDSQATRLAEGTKRRLFPGRPSMAQVSAGEPYAICRHWSFYIFPICLIFLGPPLISVVLARYLGAITNEVSSAVILVGLFLLLRRLYQWFNTWGVATGTGLVMHQFRWRNERGHFSPHAFTSVIELRKLQEAGYDQGPWDVLYGRGEVITETAATQGIPLLYGVAHVKGVSRMLAALARRPSTMDRLQIGHLGEINEHLAAIRRDFRLLAQLNDLFLRAAFMPRTPESDLQIAEERQAIFREWMGEDTYWDDTRRDTGPL
jgi:hypothetical protein